MHMAMTTIPNSHEIGIEGSIREGGAGVKKNRQVLDDPFVPLIIRLPDIRARLRQADMRQHAAGKLAGHFF